MRCCRAPELAAGGPIIALRNRLCLEPELEPQEIVHLIPFMIAVTDKQICGTVVCEGSVTSVLFLMFFFQFRNCAHAEFLRYTAELSVSSKKSDRAECQQLYVDWNKARCRIWMETIAKLSHYQQLPYKLLQLAHHDPYQRVLAAQCCLLLWKQGGVGCKHRQSRRFLDPAWQGGEGDPSLLPLVQRIARGEDMLSSHDFSPLIDWVSRFACIRLAERSVEGVHSMMTRRFEGFWTYLCNDPPVARSKWEVRVNDTYTVRLVS